MKKYTFVFMICLMAGQAWATTYYLRPNGTAADKAASEGPCTTVANCMNVTVYNSITDFNAGDVIVHCYTPLGLPGKIWSESFSNISRTVTTPTNAFKDADAKYFRASDGRYISVK
jgi:hypothetical protein